MFCNAANCSMGKSFKPWLLRFTLPMLFLFTTTLSATVQKAQENASAASSPVGADQLANVTLGLLLVLGLIFGLAWLYRRYGNLPSFNRSNIQILGGVSLGPREKAILLEVEGERLLIGVAQGQVTKLHTLPSKNNPDQENNLSDSKGNAAKNKSDEAFAMALQQEKDKSEEVTS